MIVQSYSREGMPEVKRFKAENMKPGMRVRVMMGTGLATTRAARQDQALLMWQNQIITDPEVMADLMDIPVGQLTPQKAFDVRLARNENLEMAEGVAKTPNSWDNHAIHKREHNNYRKTSEFLALPMEIQQKFEFHVEKHDELEMAQTQEELQKQQAIQGAMQGGTPQPAPTPDSVEETGEGAAGAAQASSPTPM
jgi:hypothetical protein